MHLFLVALTLILITLKLLGYITLSWWGIVPLVALLCIWPLINLILFICVVFFA